MKNKLQDLNDAELVALAMDGDISAFEEIYDRYAPGIAKTLASFSGPDRDLIDDLTQDVFFRVIKGLPSFVPSHPFAHWLYTIALNVGRNHVRRRQRVILLDANEMDNFSDHYHPIMDLSEKAMADEIFRLISHLPEHLLSVVSLRIGSGMSYGEISEVLEIPEGTARSRMHYALRKLRTKIGLQAPKGQTKEEER